MPEDRTYSQDDRIFRVEFEGSKDTFFLEGFKGKEEISKPFHFTLDLFLSNPQKTVEPDEIIHREMGLRIQSQEYVQGEVREINGVVKSFRELGFRSDGRYRFQVEIVPWIWFLSLTKNSRIFQEKTPLEVIGAVLGGYSKIEYDDSKATDGKTREFCVQYQESDLDFVTRLMEEEGIFYFFEHEGGSHKLVLTDGSSAFEPCSSKQIGFSPSVEGKSTLKELLLEHHVHSGQVVLTDFDYLNPSLELESTGGSAHPFDYMVYEHPGKYVDTQTGEANATIRALANRSFKTVVKGLGNCTAFESGRRFEVGLGAPLKGLMRDWTLVAVEHTATGLEYRSGGESAEYRNRFECLPGDVEYRPPRVTPKPVVRGSQTAMVVGSGDHELETDDLGRVKVEFHWDRDNTESCWLRVSQPWAGPVAGGMMIPHIGDEVIVDFLEGDPDRPIITGRVYNAETSTPYPLPDEKTKSYIRSLAGNEMMMEDKNGEELLYFNATKDRKVLVGEMNQEEVGTSEEVTVKKDQTLTVNGDRTVKVGGDHKETVEGNQDLTINSDRTMAVTGKLGDQVGGDRQVDVSGSNSMTVGSDLNLDVMANANVSVTGQGKISVTGATSVKGSGMIQIASQSLIILKAGSASITLTPGGDVIIKGLNVMIKGSATTEVKAGAKLTLKGAITGIN
jgi:type VI secretion system secreted protein VgrG